MSWSILKDRVELFAAEVSEDEEKSNGKSVRTPIADLEFALLRYFRYTAYWYPAKQDLELEHYLI